MGVLAVFLVVAAIAAGVFFLQLKTQREAYQTLFEQHGELSDENAKNKKSRTDAEKERDRLRDKLSKEKEGHKKVRQKLHGVRADSQTEKKPPIPTASGRQAMTLARQELVEAKAESARLEVRVKHLEVELVAARTTADVAAVMEKPVPATTDDAGVREAITAEVERSLKSDFNAKLRAQRTEASAASKELADETKSLKRRLNRALRDVDKQRARADNNQKAYEITKNQLENALDRLHEFDPSVPRPFKAPEAPKIEAGEGEAAEEKPAKKKPAKKKPAAKKKAAAKKKPAKKKAAAKKKSAAEEKPADESKGADVKADDAKEADVAKEEAEVKAPAPKAKAAKKKPAKSAKKAAKKTKKAKKAKKAKPAKKAARSEKDDAKSEDAAAEKPAKKAKKPAAKKTATRKKPAAKKKKTSTRAKKS